MSEQDGGQRKTERRDEAEEMARLQEQINNLPVSEHLLYMLHSLSSLAVDRLGLTPEGGARRDLAQAQLAIEAFRSLLGVLETARPTEEIAAHRGVLSQLQLAYVGALNAAPAGTAAPEATAESPEAAADEVPPETVAKKAAKPRASSKGTAKAAPKATGRDAGGAAGKGGKKGS